MVFNNSSLLQGFLCLKMCCFFFLAKASFCIPVRKGTKQETKNLLSQIFFFFKSTFLTNDTLQKIHFKCTPSTSGLSDPHISIFFLI